jgi:hypothetical protein
MTPITINLFPETCRQKRRTFRLTGWNGRYREKTIGLEAAAGLTSFIDSNPEICYLSQLGDEG